MDYATFVATVSDFRRPFEWPPGADAGLTTVYDEFVRHREQRVAREPIAHLANGVGVTLLAFTDDKKVVLSRRRRDASARGGELDVSVVEGMHLRKDIGSQTGTINPLRTAVRGALEELGLTVNPNQVRLLGFGVDFSFYQWNFYGRLDTNCSAEEVLAMHRLHAKDRWEGKLEIVDLEPEAVFTRIERDRMWDTGLVTAYLALCDRLDVRPVRTAVSKVFTTGRSSYAAIG